MTTDTPMDPSAEESMADDWAQALEEQTRSSGSDGAPAFDAAADSFAPMNKAAGGANDINMVLVTIFVPTKPPKKRAKAGVIKNTNALLVKTQAVAPLSMSDITKLILFCAKNRYSFTISPQYGTNGSIY